MSASKLPAISFPPEIIEAILRLLPAKSLGRFKSVSKTWNSLISDPQFIKKHIHHLQTPTKLILHSEYTDALHSFDTDQLLPYLNIDNNDDDIPATVKELFFGSAPMWCQEILGSCNGLVLAKDVHCTIFLINPTTQELWKVPTPPFALPDIDWAVSYEFGYVSSTDDYKVLLSFQRENTCVSVYSLRNNSWKEIRISPYDLGDSGFLPVVVNQHFHRYKDSSSIAAFSFVTEEFNEINLQFLDLFVDKSVAIYEVVAIGEKLGLFISVGGAYELWVMEDYGVANSWTRICPHQLKDYSRPVCLVEGSNRDMVLNGEGDIVIFNMDKRKYRNVRIQGFSEEYNPEEFNVRGIYVESLESAKRFVK
ncbi:hypothetical protein SSX86_001408 [Deinandra increscens subsp. villosa]|uniref:F-box domain-containing protein n=1 Tax=Deinandra increscens subsp. villosa TaxID=3103831 RepID=A0AAP0DR91_9ASTR